LRGQGTSVHGSYKLIYDDVQDITFYDFSRPANRAVDNVLEDHINWAAGLEVELYGVTFSDWRLPTAAVGDRSSPDWFWDGTGDEGYNNTTGELGHLYYESLGNLGPIGPDGTNPQPGWGLVNTGPFSNFGTQTNPDGSTVDIYWTGTYPYDPVLPRRVFRSGSGLQMSDAPTD
jgi:hypothetical protein